MLDEVGIPHMVVGSFASTFHGPPRSTRDIDIVVELTEDSLRALLNAVDRARYYVADTAARVALNTAGQFNLVDLRSGWKIDFIVRKDRPFSREEFARREAVTMDGVAVFVATAEDTVLSKLEWAARGGSERQVADAASVLAVAGPSIDDGYLDRWASELGVQDLLATARRDAKS
jgi:hypothetical protein